jgi:hypothetical protein
MTEAQLRITPTKHDVRFIIEYYCGHSIVFGTKEFVV